MQFPILGFRNEIPFDGTTLALSLYSDLDVVCIGWRCHLACQFLGLPLIYTAVLEVWGKFSSTCSSVSLLTG
jgi:hypothetical protein